VSPVRYRIGDLEINTATRQVRRGSREVALTKGEYGLLELLAKGSPRVLSKDTIIAAMWGFNADVSRNNLEVFVHFLRSKLEHPGESKLIRTIRGIGYSLGEDEP
jgi:DNA-binding response OmpR family regulator